MDLFTCPIAPVRGGDGLLPPPHRAGSVFHRKNLYLSLMEDPYQNNDVTCGMPVIGLVRGDGVQVPHMRRWGAVGRLLSPCSGNVF